jgi:hypothetical protein
LKFSSTIFLMTRRGFFAPASELGAVMAGAFAGIRARCGGAHVDVAHAALKRSGARDTDAGLLTREGRGKRRFRCDFASLCVSFILVSSFGDINSIQQQTSYEINP